MQYNPTRSLCATVAIAATLALGSTPAFAQDVAPAISVPAASPPSAPAPTIVVPPVTVQPTAPQPVAEAAPEPAPRQAPAPRARAERPAPAPRQAVAAAPAAPAAAAPVPVAAIPAAAPVAPIAQAPLPAAAPAPVAEPAPVAQADDGLSGEEIGFLALLAAIGAGGIALLVKGKRRRRADGEADVRDYADAPAPAAQPVYEAPVLHTPVQTAMDRSAQPAVVRSVAPVATGPVPAGEARHALLDSMTDAEPDEANPFTSKKARRRRARLILQAQEAEHGTDTRAFDWRTYEPSTRRQPAEPELA